jgi:DNA-binding phage protein
MDELQRNKSSDILKKRMGIKESFGNSEFIIDQLASFLKEGDFSSSTDLIAAYISNSPKYKNQDEFAQAIGTTRQTLHRMFAHENVSLNVFFKAIERIYDDID